MNFNFSKYVRQQLVIRETATDNWPFVRVTLFTCHRNLERRRPISGVNKIHLPVRSVPQSISNRPTTTYWYCRNVVGTGVFCAVTQFVIKVTGNDVPNEILGPLAHWDNLKARKICNVSNSEEMVTLHYTLLY